MARGGHRRNSGRPSTWQSSTETKAIRIPAWMADELLYLAKKLDRGETIGNVHNQNISSKSLEPLQVVVDRWQLLVPPGQEKSPRWKKTYELLADLTASLSELREGG